MFVVFVVLFLLFFVVVVVSFPLLCTLRPRSHGSRFRINRSALVEKLHVSLNVSILRIDASAKEKRKKKTVKRKMLQGQPTLFKVCSISR